MKKRINIQKIIEIVESGDFSGQRFYTKAGKRINSDAYRSLDPQEKEAFEFPGEVDFSKIDKVLKDLNEKWEKELNPIKKDILMLNYDILIEKTGFLDEEDKKEIEKLSKYIELLTKLNKAINYED